MLVIIGIILFIIGIPLTIFVRGILGPLFMAAGIVLLEAALEND